MNPNQVKPLGNRILIKRQEQSMQKGQILLPETAKEKPMLGEVLSMGPGTFDKEGKLTPLSIKVGDVVLFSSYSGTEVSSDVEGDYLLLSEDDVFAVIE